MVRSRSVKLRLRILCHEHRNESWEAGISARVHYILSRQEGNCESGFPSTKASSTVCRGLNRAVSIPPEIVNESCTVAPVNSNLTRKHQPTNHRSEIMS